MNFECPEGATPIDDCSDLLLPWVQNMADLNRVEAENISHAQRKYLRATHRDISLWFRYKDLQTIHRAMVGKVWAWAGKQRKISHLNWNQTRFYFPVDGRTLP